MKIEGLSTFKNFKEYFDGVKNKLTKTHKAIVGKLNENKGPEIKAQTTTTNIPPDSANL